MKTLICEMEIDLLAILSPIVFIVLFLVVVVSVIIYAKKAQQNMQKHASERKYTDGDGLTQHQSDYLQHLRTKQTEQKVIKQETTHTHVGDKIVAESDGHTHLAGDEEFYDDIVGSLGEVSDEGCQDLSGVRFIAHDLAYEDGEEQRDYSQLVQAMILGDVINQPRCKHPYGKK